MTTDSIQTNRTNPKQYVEVLDKLKRTSEELAARNRYLEARIEHDKELQKREERLLMAAVYEVGAVLWGWCDDEGEGGGGLLL